MYATVQHLKRKIAYTHEELDQIEYIVSSKRKELIEQQKKYSRQGLDALQHIVWANICKYLPIFDRTTLCLVCRRICAEMQHPGLCFKIPPIIYFEKSFKYPQTFAGRNRFLIRRDDVVLLEFENPRKDERRRLYFGIVDKICERVVIINRINMEIDKRVNNGYITKLGYVAVKPVMSSERGTKFQFGYMLDDSGNIVLREHSCVNVLMIYDQNLIFIENVTAPMMLSFQ